MTTCDLCHNGRRLSLWCDLCGLWDTQALFVHLALTLTLTLILILIGGFAFVIAYAAAVETKIPDTKIYG